MVDGFGGCSISAAGDVLVSVMWLIGQEVSVFVDLVDSQAGSKNASRGHLTRRTGDVVMTGQE
jgi:hypothetical protein